MSKVKTTAAIAAFACTVPAANWMIGNVGTVCVPDGPCLIPVAPGLMAPSGVLLVGLALVLRDLVHERAGATAAALAVVAGAALSFATADPRVAVASAVAYLLAETVDFAVYTPLRRRGLALAVAASGVVGAFADSAVFTRLAFGSFEFSAGNTLGKLYASAAAAILIVAIRKWKAAR